MGAVENLYGVRDAQRSGNFRQEKKPLAFRKRFGATGCPRKTSETDCESHQKNKDPSQPYKQDDVGQPAEQSAEKGRSCADVDSALALPVFTFGGEAQRTACAVRV